jgi:hypothetical protein
MKNHKFIILCLVIIAISLIGRGARSMSDENLYLFSASALDKLLISKDVHGFFEQMNNQPISGSIYFLLLFRVLLISFLV